MEYCIGFIYRVGYLPCIPEVDSPSSLELEIVHRESIVKCSYWNKSDSTPLPSLLNINNHGCLFLTALLNYAQLLMSSKYMYM